MTGQSPAAQFALPGGMALAVILVLALCALGSRLELRRDERKARARKREAGGER